MKDIASSRAEKKAKQVTRREFLRQSLVAGAAVGAGLRSFSVSSYNRIVGANNDIRVAVVGHRIKGADHIDVFRNLPGVRVAALCEVDDELLARESQKFKDRNETVKTYRDVRRLLDDKEIDAVVIATPNHWHALMGIWACQAGKDVYVEKPVSHNIWEGRQLVEAARKYQRIVQSGMQNRSDVGFAEAAAYLQAGNLGKVLWAHSVWYGERQSIGRVDQPQPIPANIDYNLWTGPAPLTPLMRKQLHYDWHWFWETGSGEMGNWGPHQIDDCRFAMNLAGLPRRVMSFGGRFVFDDNAETPNTHIAILDYAAAPVIIEIRNLPAAAGQRMMDHLRGVRVGNIIQCEHGYFAGGRGGGWAYDNNGNKLKQFAGDGGGTHQANFIAAMRSRKPDELRAEILKGHISSLLCHVANISYRVGKGALPEQMQEEIFPHAQTQETLERYCEHLLRNGVDLQRQLTVWGPWLQLDARKERFIGEFSSAANKFVTRRKYRKPFVVPKKV
ncbi:Gfo/Idh/MocA family oxidoreductase [candidate division KSB1 bacterium]|nr:Gfo/Idh/MocA family oxidoreductase [candidate division KSB1 bacterium]